MKCEMKTRRTDIQQVIPSIHPILCFSEIAPLCVCNNFLLKPYTILTLIYMYSDLVTMNEINTNLEYFIHLSQF